MVRFKETGYRSLYCLSEKVCIYKTRGFVGTLPQHSGVSKLNRWCGGGG